MKKSCVKRMFKRMRNTPALAEAIVEDNKEFNLNGTVDRASRVSAADILGGAKAAKKDKDGEVIDIPVAESEAE